MGCAERRETRPARPQCVGTSRVWAGLCPKVEVLEPQLVTEGATAGRERNEGPGEAEKREEEICSGVRGRLSWGPWRGRGHLRVMEAGGDGDEGEAESKRLSTEFSPELPGSHSKKGA